MKYRFNRKAHPILELARKQQGKTSELGKKLEKILKKKYAAMRKEAWQAAAQCRADEAELRKKLEDLLVAI